VGASGAEQRAMLTAVIETLCQVAAKAGVSAAREAEGWAASIGDSVCGWFGCTTVEEMAAKLQAEGGNFTSNQLGVLQDLLMQDSTLATLCKDFIDDL